jgi:CRP/FNR family transcriptional regulator, anaerobic regulatory protein
MQEDFPIEKKFSYLGPELLREIKQVADIRTFPKNTELVRDGQYIKVIPIVLQGLVKVYTQFEDKEILLYYIQPDQSCIMSFSSAIHNEKSKIFAITEDTSTILLLPSDKVTQWIKQYPTINTLFYQQYDLRYNELMDSIHHLLYYKLDKRLLDYLSNKIQLTGKNPLKISHKEIATDLGTAREVISRLVKKMEHEQILKQHHDSIELL